jgi:hypothetical protein
MDPKSDHIQSKERHRRVINHARIPNLASVLPKNIKNIILESEKKC